MDDGERVRGGKEKKQRKEELDKVRKQTQNHTHTVRKLCIKYRKQCKAKAINKIAVRRSYNLWPFCLPRLL